MNTLIKLAIVAVFLLLLSLVLIGGVVLLQEPKCTTATPKEQLEMRCQKALSHYRG